jgi:hypothetical protein
MLLFSSYFNFIYFIFSVGAIDPFGNEVALDSQIAIQERTLTSHGLNLYDGATWEIALALAGMVLFLFVSDFLLIC